jgi:hypothetical protein
MKFNKNSFYTLLTALYLIFCTLVPGSSTVLAGLAGPPYDTDDPEPVALYHWEFYIASHISHETDLWESSAPQFEVNYSAVKDLQFHMIVPLSYNSETGNKTNYGLGDLELGFKYRFLKEGKNSPQIAVFPIVELPLGNTDKGLGGGEIQIILPIWLQKSFGKFTTYGGAGLWINPGDGNKNWWFSGWQIQYNLNDNINFGTEITHSTSKEIDGESETRFNIGSVINLNEHHHLLLSAGRGIGGPVKFQGYVGYQLTL